MLVSSSPRCLLPAHAVNSPIANIPGYDRHTSLSRANPLHPVVWTLPSLLSDCRCGTERKKTVLKLSSSLPPGAASFSDISRRMFSLEARR